MTEFFTEKTVLVTGAAGSVGSALVQELLHLPVKAVRAVDLNESTLFDLEQRHQADLRFEAFLCDIRDERTMPYLMGGVDLVFHTAALKQVPFGERNPLEIVRTNILGLQTVIEAARRSQVERVLFTSSDKAVNPTSVMGTSKLMGERLITAANAVSTPTNPVFSSVRFGNVAGSKGSVIPLFCDQIAAGGPVTLTDRRMTRFMMNLGQAVQLMLNAIQRASGGEVFVTKMPVIRIEDLARVLVDLLAPAFGFSANEIEVQETNPRPGEKIHEELLGSEEVRRTFDLVDFLAVVPPFGDIYRGTVSDYQARSTRPVQRAYVSSNETALGQQKILDFLLGPAVLPTHARTALEALSETRQA